MGTRGSISNIHTKPRCQILVGAVASFPFVVVRITYAFLSIFKSNSLQSKWDALYGSATAFVLMVLIMEYIVVIIFIVVGIRIPRVNKELGKKQDSVV